MAKQNYSFIVTVTTSEKVSVKDIAHDIRVVIMSEMCQPVTKVTVTNVGESIMAKAPVVRGKKSVAPSKPSKPIVAPKSSAKAPSAKMKPRGKC